MKRILITGFMPFNNASLNPAWEAVKGVTAPEGVELVKKEISVVFGQAIDELLQAVEELHPDLVIGESLGSIHALAVKGVPHILVSPSLGAPRGLTILSWLSLIPGMGVLFSKIWHPKEGDRQELLFDYGHLRGWMLFRRKALDNSPRMGGRDYFFAFFGTRDHYRRLGVVSVRKWRKYFGKDSYRIYDGTHFMEEEYILSLLIPKIIQVLGIKS